MAEAQAPKSKGMERVKGLDLYELLGVEVAADAKTIKKAYRKKALTCHPDKNPDDKKAIELFHQLSDALEVLTDENTRKAYDNVLKARKAQEIRVRAMDAKRQKLKDKLDKGEKLHEEEMDMKLDEEAKFAAEVERLRKEGSRQLEEEQEAMKKQMAEEARAKASNNGTTGAARVKVRWDRKVVSWPYDKDNLVSIFSKYGEVTAVVVNAKKGGSALIEFANMAEAQMAAKIETGFPGNKLTVKPLWEEERVLGNMGGASNISNGHSASDVIDLTGPQGCQGALSNDFESLVMRNMRQAEERRKLIAQMLAEEKEAS